MHTQFRPAPRVQGLSGKVVFFLELLYKNVVEFYVKINFFLLLKKY